MNHDRLTRLVTSHSDADIVAFFDDLDEPERAEYRDVPVAVFDGLDPDSPNYKTIGSAALAMLGAATFSQIKALGWRGFFADDESCFAVLANRNPKWLADWCAWRLEERLVSWPMVRRFVNEGLIEEPDTEPYALGLIEAFGFRNDGDIYQGLKNDPDLLDGLVWRLFEVEGGGETSLANYEKFLASKFDRSWTDALQRLSAEGLLDRNRLLDASLDALNRDFSQYRAGWFSRFHESLEPTLDERTSRAGKYLVLLASPIGPTVSFALKALQVLQKGKKLDPGAFTAAVEPVFFAKSAGSVKTALRMLVNVIKAAPDMTDVALVAIAAGLEHSNTDIQSLSLETIVKEGSPHDDALRSAVESRLPVISAVLKPRAQAFLGAPDTDIAPIPVAAGSDDLIARINRIPGPVRQLAGLDSAVAALENGLADPGRAEFGSLDIPRLRSLEPMKAIDTVPDLVGAALHVFANPHDIDAAEQVIGSAFAMRPEIDADLVAPLAAKLKKTAQAGRFVWEGEATIRCVFVVLDAWLKLFGFSDRECNAAIGNLVQMVKAKPGSTERQFGLETILLRRSLELADHIAHGRAGALLSLPTHAGGWIDPACLIARALSWQEAGEAPASADQILALLRLAPDGRADALTSASGIEGEWGAALRYALGGDEMIGACAELWIAAARARNPSGDDAAIEDKWPGLGAGGGMAGRIGTDVQWRSSDYDGGTIHHYDFSAIVEPQGALVADRTLPLWQRAVRGKLWGAKPDLTLLPTIMAHDFPERPVSSGFISHPLGTQWAITVWPSYPDLPYTAAALMMDRYDGELRNVSNPPPAGYRLVLDPDVPLTMMGIIMICRALNDHDPGDQQSGADALAQTIEDGRLDAACFGRELHRLLLTGIIYPKRSAPRLREVADISPLHRLTVCKALERAFHGGEPVRPLRDLHAWLDLLLELLIETGEMIEDEATKTFLGTLSGSSKAAKTARKLLALQLGDFGSTRKAAALYAIEKRLERAERWT